MNSERFLTGFHNNRSYQWRAIFERPYQFFNPWSASLKNISAKFFLFLHEVLFLCSSQILCALPGLLHSMLLHLASALRRCTGAPVPGSASSSRCRCRMGAKIWEIFMPALISTMTEGKIVSWTTAEGDPVIVIKSDKAAMDVETFHDGFLTTVLVPGG
jgi:hypothetical protein